MKIAKKLKFFTTSDSNSYFYVEKTLNKKDSYGLTKNIYYGEVDYNAIMWALSNQRGEVIVLEMLSGKRVGVGRQQTLDLLNEMKSFIAGHISHTNAIEIRLQDMSNIHANCFCGCDC